MENKVKEIRIASNLTQVELAEKAGVSRSIIASLESGAREVVTSRTMKKISDALNYPIQNLFF